MLLCNSNLMAGVLACPFFWIFELNAKYVSVSKTPSKAVEECHNKSNNLEQGNGRKCDGLSFPLSCRSKGHASRASTWAPLGFAALDFPITTWEL